jgi:hypothetical protein
MKHVFEIYTKNPKTGQTGWDIKFVYASDVTIKTFPHFDCVITRDDCPAGTKIINWM